MSSSAYERILENLQFLKSKESLDVLDKTFDQVNQNNLSFIDGFLYFTEAQVEKKKEIIEKVQTNEFWDKVTIIELDTVREALRGLLQYLDRQVRPIYYTNFTDSITEGTPGEPLYGGNDFKNYRKKVEFYLKEHSDKLSVYKLKNNKKLTETDLRELERILWTELGSKEDYIKELIEERLSKNIDKLISKKISQLLKK